MSSTNAEVSLQERLEAATEDLARCQVAADVAEILRVEGVQGERGRCAACPVAVLVMKRLGPGFVVWVTGSEIDVYPEAGAFISAARVPTPRAAQEFIAEFDGDEEEQIPGGWDEFAVTSP